MSKQKKRVKTGWAIKTKDGSFFQIKEWHWIYQIYTKRRDALDDVQGGDTVVKVEIREL